jgi:hypothetical protein
MQEVQGAQRGVELGGQLCREVLVRVHEREREDPYGALDADVRITH